MAREDALAYLRHHLLHFQSYRYEWEDLNTSLVDNETSEEHDEYLIEENIRLNRNMMSTYAHSVTIAHHLLKERFVEIPGEPPESCISRLIGMLGKKPIPSFFGASHYADIHKRALEEWGVRAEDFRVSEPWKA